MSGTRSTDLARRVETYRRLEDLPGDAASLLTGTRGFFASRAWWDTVLTHAIPAGASPRLLVIRDGGAARAIFPMLLDPAAGGFRSLTTPYTCLFAPLFDPGASETTELVEAFARACRRFPTTRLDGLDEAGAAEIASGGRRAGLIAAPFEHFGNWYEDVSGLDWKGYLARRPGALRETIRRRSNRAARLTGARLEWFGDGAGMEPGIAAFEAVYARSWKDPEPFPAINPAQIRAAASLGMARLGVWWIDDVPAAAQFWIVEPWGATVLKLAHDEAFNAYSPGTVLTAWMIRRLIEQERVAVLDFGRGDDPYKRDWAGMRRPRLGVLLINPWRPSGFAALVRHIAGRLRARFRGSA